MAETNFEACLGITLKWEGGYSNNADDPGGPTMRGITQANYDAFRKKSGKSKQPVRKLSEDELRAIYRHEYWDALGCDNLPVGLDLCVFDAGVNSGVSRAKQWLEHEADIDAYCNARLGFLRNLGRLWRVFGPGWARRVSGIRVSAHAMENSAVAEAPLGDAGELHAGMKGPKVLELQTALRKLGYPCGLVDGMFSDQTYRAVILFQTDHDTPARDGAWRPEYNDMLAGAEPMLPKRAEATAKDLERQGDVPVRRMNFLQRMFAWVFGAGALGQATSNTNLLDTLSSSREAIEPLQGIAEWVTSNKWILIMVAAVTLIAFVRYMLSRHVENFQSFTYQGGSNVDGSN